METKPINHKLVYELRLAARPVHEHHLIGLYSDPSEYERDVETLSRHGLVKVTPYGVSWAGS